MLLLLLSSDLYLLLGCFVIYAGRFRNWLLNKRCERRVFIPEESVFQGFRSAKIAPVLWNCICSWVLLSPLLQIRLFHWLLIQCTKPHFPARFEISSDVEWSLFSDITTCGIPCCVNRFQWNWICWSILKRNAEVANSDQIIVASKVAFVDPDSLPWPGWHFLLKHWLSLIVVKCATCVEGWGITLYCRGHACL